MFDQKGLSPLLQEHDACGIGAVVSIEGKATHKTVDDALKIVEKLEHRAGKDAAGETGDGVGILLQISHTFFSKAAAAMGIDLGGPRDYGVGMFFLPGETLPRRQAQKRLEVIARKEGMEFWAGGMCPPGGDSRPEGAELHALYRPVLRPPSRRGGPGAGVRQAPLPGPPGV